MAKETDNFVKSSFGWLELVNYSADPIDTDADRRGLAFISGALKYWSGSAWAAVTASGVTTFVALTDTPSNYTSAANKIVKVNTGATALEFVTVGGVLAMSAAGAFSIVAGSIVNVDINTAANIAVSKLALTTGSVIIGASSVGAALDVKGDGKIIVGNGTTATSVAVSGDITLSNLGVVAIVSGVIVNDDINAAAAIAWSKLATSTDITNAGKVNDLTITSEAAGDILYFNGSNWVRLAKPGSSGYYLEGGTTPVWTLPSLASASSIQTGATLLDAGANDATITFTTQTVAGASVVIPDFAAAAAFTFAFLSKAQTWSANQTVQYGKLLLGDVDNGQTLQILVNENMTGNKTLTILPFDTNRQISMKGNLTISGDLITVGDDSLTFTTSAATDVTLPTTGTLATLAGAESLSAKTLTAAKIATTDGFFDAGGDEYLLFTEATTPVNFLRITSADAGVAPMLTADGSDDNIDLMLHGKGTGNVVITDGGDITAKVVFELDGATTAKAMTITCSHTDNRALTLPDATDTLVGKATTDTFTNKTFDCDGTGNVLSNVNATELDPVGDGATGIPFIVRKTVADIAAAGTNIITTHPKMRVLDAWFVSTSADSGTLAIHVGQVGSVGASIVTAMTIPADDMQVTRADEIDDAAWDVAVNGGLVAVGDAGASVDGTVYVLCMRID